jgi:hypothetical protein
MSLKELKPLVENAKQKQGQYAKAFESSSNPQTKALYHQSTGAYEALVAVSEYLAGQGKASLTILAGQ